MSKAEERAFERCPKSENAIEEMRNERKRAIFIEGYHQAEKDNELTWEDVRLLDLLCCKVDMSCDLEEKEHYEEVQKRFKERKEK